MARKVWLPILMSHEGFLPYLCCDPPNPAATQTVQALYPRVEVAASQEEVVGTHPDLVWITTPNTLHASQAIYFLEKNISVFIEKPVCITPSESAGLSAAVQNGDAYLFPSRASLMRQDIQILKDQIRQGAVGQIRFLEISWVRGKGIPSPGSWFTRKATAGGGVGLDLGWHMLDVGLGLLEYPRTRKAMAFAFNDHLTHTTAPQADWHGNQATCASAPSDVEDTLWATAETENGQGIQLRVAWASDESLDRTCISVHGIQGKLELTTTFGFSPYRDRQPRLILKQRGKETAISIPKEPLGTEYHRQVSTIHRHILAKGGKQSPLVGIDAIVNCIGAIYDRLS